MSRRNPRAAGVPIPLAVIAGLIAICALRPPPPTFSSIATPPPTSPPVPQPASPSPAVSLPAPAATATPQIGGAITGRFGYPSDFIPPVTLYAISTTDARVWYSVESAGFGNPPRPTLPPRVSQAP